MSTSVKRSPVKSAAKIASVKRSPVKTPVKSPVKKSTYGTIKDLRKKVNITNTIKMIVIITYVATAYLNFDQYNKLVELESNGIDIADGDKVDMNEELVVIRDNIINYTITEITLIGLRLLLSFGSNFGMNMTMVMLATIKWLILTTSSPIVEIFVDIITFFASLFGNDVVTRGYAVRQVTLINGMLSVFGMIFTIVPLARIIVNISLALLSAGFVFSQINI